MKHLNINCRVCNKEILIEPKRYNQAVKHNQKVFCCSRNCWKIYRVNIKSETIKCPECDKEFTRNKTLKRLKKFCSQRCANIHSQRFTDMKQVSVGLKRFYASDEGKALLAEKSNKTRKNKTCICCEKTFYGHRKYCSKQCQQKMSPIHISETRKNMFADGSLEVTGGTTKWLTYKNIRVQGTHEYRTCIILDKLKDLNLIKDWHRSRLRIPYIGDDNKVHTYLIDFEIISKSGKIIYLEIKGWIHPKDILKWNEMKKLSYTFVVWMNKHLEQIESKLKI